MGMILKEFLSVLTEYQADGPLDRFILDVTDDSRKSGRDCLFVCLTGERSDGYDYIDEACRRGAVALLVDRPLARTPQGVTIITVPQTRVAMQKLIPYFYGYPAREMKMCGITGTNGKTTASYMLRSIIEAWGKKSGVIGTLGVVAGNERFSALNTTPDVPLLQALLRDMREKNTEYVIMEVSSHALALDRVAGCEFDLAVMTNVTQDHLDFHKTFEAYLEAKTKLFSSLPTEGYKAGRGVVNADDPNAPAFLRAARVPVLTYGQSSDCDVYPNQQRVYFNGMELLLVTPAGELALTLKTTGHFNVYNTMAAVASALSLGAPLSSIKRGLDGFKGVPGRFELVEAGQPFTVIVDYAHTPDGLDNLLRSVRQITQGRLITIFGCGGNRDKGKRPLMGEIAVRLSDLVCVTSDNPRKELPEDIINDIISGIGQTGNYIRVADRAAAIHTALSEAKDGDSVVIAGKGHETYQILADETIDFDDKLVASSFLREKFLC